MVKYMGPGPVFRFEARLAARRGSLYVARSLFVAGLLAGLLLVWWNNIAGQPLGSIREQAEVGQAFYLALASTQLVMAILSAPAAMVGSICGDRSRGVLAHLLATDLSSAEIVLGTLGARLLPVTTVVLCGVPFLMIGSLLGGVDPSDLLGVVLVTLGTATLGCALALVIAIEGSKPTESSLVGHGVWLAVILAPPVWSFLRRNVGVAIWPPPWWLEQTNPFVFVFMSRPGSFAATLEGRLCYFLLMLGLALMLAGVATLRLRTAAAKEPVGRRALVRRFWRLPGPSLDGNPVLWREWQFQRPGWWGLAFWGVYLAASFGCTTLIVWMAMWGSKRQVEGCAILNALQVSAGMLLLSLSASSSLAQERMRGSLDVLFTTPLSTESILWGKWWGAFRMVPLVVVPAGASYACVAAWQRGPFAWILALEGTCLVLCYGVLVTTLGLALAVWMTRPGHAAVICAAIHIGITVGWIFLVGLLFKRGSAVTSTGLALFSPFFGVIFSMLASVLMGYQQVAELRLWLIFWCMVELAIAGVLFAIVLDVFDGRLGRASQFTRTARDEDEPGEHVNSAEATMSLHG